MNKIVKYAAVTTIVAATGLTALNVSADWGRDRGDCSRSEQRGDWTMDRSSMDKRQRMANRELNLTAEEAKTLVEANLIMRGNKRLQAGQVAEKDDNTYLVDIVTVDNSLVQQVEVDKNQGMARPSFRAGK